MRIEKYNQRLLAVLGTVGLVFLMVALISFITFTINDFLRNRGNDVQEGILSDEKIEELQKENKREQVISYETPRLIDTLNSIYIIPVSHKTLNKKEEIDVGSLLGLDNSSSLKKSSDRRYSSKYYGAYNNLIVYNPKNDVIKKLFDSRVNFNQIKTEYFEDDILILMNVSEKDTHKDGVINLSDLQSLYIYSMANEKLRKIGIEGMDVSDYTFLHNEKNLTIRFGVDKNKDGKYTARNEPTLIKKYDLENGILTNIINEELNSTLQKTLEGSTK